MELFTFLQKVWQEAGVIGMLSVTVCSIAILMFIITGKDVSMTMLKKLWRRKKDKLIEHDLFKYLDVMVDHQIPVLIIVCPLRNRIFKKLLDVKFRDLRDAFRVVAEQAEKEQEEFDAKNIFSSLFLEHNHKWVEKAYIAKIPDAAILKFNEFYSAYTKPLEAVVQDILLADNKVKLDTIEKVRIIFSIVKTMLFVSLLAAEKTLCSLNGELSEVTFDGERCKNCNVKCNFKSEEQCKHVV